MHTKKIIPNFSALLSTTTESEPLPALQAGPRWQVFAAKVPHLANPRSHACWVDRKASVQGQDGRPRLVYLVRHLRYAHSPVSPDSILTLRQQIKMIENFGNFSSMEKAAFFATSYTYFQAALGMNNALTAKSTTFSERSSQSARYDSLALW